MRSPNVLQTGAATVVTLAAANMLVTACSNDDPAKNTETDAPMTDGITETVQSGGGVEVFADYRTAGGLFRNKDGQEVSLEKGDEVEMECLMFDPETEITSTSGVWYKLISTKSTAADGLDVEGAYVAANSFYNQENIGGPEENNVYDPAVPLCEDSPSQEKPDLRDPLGVSKDIAG